MPPSPTPVGSSGDLRRRWIVAMLVGELLGFAPPAVAGAALAARGASDAVLVLGLTVAGACEGAVLGAAQAWVLERHAPSVDGLRWTIATATAAAFAWLVGMGGGALMGAEAAAQGVLLVVFVPLWAAALLAMGFGQWRVLRRAVPRSGRWVWVTAGAWLVGVVIPVAALSLAPNSWPLWAHAIVGVAAAVAMGLTVGALTGGTLDRLLGASTDGRVPGHFPGDVPTRGSSTSGRHESSRTA